MAEQARIRTRRGRAQGLAAWLALLLAWAGVAGGAWAQEERAPEAAEPAGTVLAGGAPIALYPVENLAGAEAPVADLHAALRARLEALSVPILDQAGLDAFMRRHRVRHVGGLPRDTARALRDELGVGAVLLASVDLYQKSDPPKLAFTARLVSVEDDQPILWMDSAAGSGDAAPGFLGLGRIADIGPIEDQVLGGLIASFAARLAPAASLIGREGERLDFVPNGPTRRYLPRTLFLSPRAAIDRRPIRVAVLPLDNQSTTRHAGDIVSLQLVRSLAAAPGIDVVEPGIVREALLRSRVVQEEGLSAPQAELVRIILNADVVVFGEVTQYVETWAGAAEPLVDFLVRAMDTRTRQVILAARSRAQGDDGVFFFGLGRVPTAHQLSAGLVRALILRTVSSLEAES